MYLKNVNRTSDTVIKNLSPYAINDLRCTGEFKNCPEPAFFELSFIASSQLDGKRPASVQWYLPRFTRKEIYNNNCAFLNTGIS